VATIRLRPGFWPCSYFYYLQCFLVLKIFQLRLNSLPEITGEYVKLFYLNFNLISYRDGNDGPWSTFTIGVGSPPQAIRVIPSVAQNIVTVVRPEECLGYLYGFQNCSEARGGVYRYNESSTWRSNGIHDVDPTNNSLFKRTLHFGTDTVGLGTKPQASRMTNQTVALMLQLPPSYIGIVGISPVPINYTEDNTQVPTFFESLRSSTRIGARTWSYTAGSFNRKTTWQYGEYNLIDLNIRKYPWISYSWWIRCFAYR
jgi:hypothetical protein